MSSPVTVLCIPITLLTHHLSERFRWASLQLELLCTLKLDADVRATLGRLPPSLQELYTEMYERQMIRHPGEVGRATIYNILVWLLCAQRRLSSSELRTAVAMNLSISTEELSRDHILDLCQNFIVYDTWLDVFFFSHLSVREFLESRPEYAPDLCHVVAAEVCLIQLVGSTNSSTARDFLTNNYSGDVSSKLAPILKPYRGGFHEYSVLLWMQHCVCIGESGRRDHDHFQRIFRFFLPFECGNDSPLHAWVHSYRRHCDDIEPHHDVVGLIETQKASATPLFVACAFGFCEIICETLKKRHITIEDMQTAVDVVSFTDQDESLITLLVSRGNLDIPESIVHTIARNVKAETLLWVLRQVPGIKLTAGLAESASMSHKHRCKERALVLLNHFNAADLSSEVLAAIAGVVNGSTFKAVLNQRPDIHSSKAMLETAVHRENHEVVNLLVLEYGLKLSDTTFESLVVECDRSILEALLSSGGYTISSRAMRQAVSNEDTGVFQLLLDRGGVISHSVTAMVARCGSAPILQSLLDCGHTVIKTMLLLAASNWRDTHAVLDLLLTRADDDLIQEQSDAVLKRVAATSRDGLPDLIRLRSRVKAETFSGDVFIAAMRNWLDDFNIKNLLIECYDKVLDPEVLETLVAEVKSVELMQLLLNNLDDSRVTEQLLKAAAENCYLGDEILGILLGKSSKHCVSEDVINGAMSNSPRGREVLILLDKYMGEIAVTEGLLVRVASFVEPQVLEFLLNRSTREVMTENVIISAMKATRSRQLMLNPHILLERNPDLPITEKVLERAAHDVCYETFKLMWVRCNHPIVSSALLQAAAENWLDLAIMRFLLSKAQDVDLEEKIVAAMIRNNPGQSMEIFEEFLARSVRFRFQIPRRALMEAAKQPTTSVSIMKFLLKIADIGAVNDELIQMAAASARDDILVMLCQYCGMGEVPSKWTDIARLHDAAAQHAWYFLDESEIPDNDSCDSDAEISPVRELLARNVPCDLPDGHGATPLALAAKAGNELIVKALLHAGANPDSRDRLGRSPLFHAASSDHYEIALVLLEKGVQTDLVDLDGMTLVESARKGGNMKIYRLLKDYSRGEK